MDKLTFNELSKVVEHSHLQHLFVVFDCVSINVVFCSLAFNSSDFMRQNIRMLRSLYQIKDLRFFDLGDIVSVLNSVSNAIEITPATYRFDTEAQELSKLGLKQDEIEAYFAERSKQNKGITESQIISIMENFISQNKDKILSNSENKE